MVVVIAHHKYVCNVISSLWVNAQNEREKQAIESNPASEKNRKTLTASKFPNLLY